MTALHKLFWVCVENVLVRVEEASRSGHSKNRLELASSGVSFVLGMALQSQTSRRTEACQQRGSRPDLPYGCRESDLGSAAHSWRTTEAGFRSLGKKLFLVKSLCQLHPFLRCRNTSLHPRDVRHWNKRCGTQILLPWPGGWHRLPAETQPLAASDKRA